MLNGLGRMTIRPRQVERPLPPVHALVVPGFGVEPVARHSRVRVWYGMCAPAHPAWEAIAARLMEAVTTQRLNLVVRILVRARLEAFQNKVLMTAAAREAHVRPRPAIALL